MDKVRAGILVFKGGKLPAEERDSRISRKVITDNLSGFKLNDEEDIEAFKAKDIHGEEIGGKEGLPVGSKEAFPETGRLEVA
jgi:hypothetical protein